jgi:hypothetical protein
MYDKDKILKKKLLRCKTTFFSHHITGFYFKDFSIEIRLFVWKPKGSLSRKDETSFCWKKKIH